MPFSKQASVQTLTFPYQVVRMLGNGRLEAQCIDGKKRLCHIRGKMRKKVWVASGDVVLVGLRDYQDEKADVIMKYTADEARVLKVSPRCLILMVLQICAKPLEGACPLTVGYPEASACHKTYI